MNRLVQSPGHLVAVLSWVHLLALTVLWELIAIPEKPAYLWAAVKLLPLLIALPGIVRARSYTMQWASMLVLLYMAEGCVRGMGAGGASQLLGWAQFALAWAAFFGLILHIRPLKKAAKAAKAAQLPVAVQEQQELESTPSAKIRAANFRNTPDA